MRPAGAGAIAGLILSLAAGARGEAPVPSSEVTTEPRSEVTPPLPQRAVSLELVSLLGNVVNLAVPRGNPAPPPGLEVNGEMLSPDRHWSVVVALGTRWSTSGEDFRSWTRAAGVEGRYWLRLG